MPRTGPRRPSVTLRISEAGVAYLDAWAQRESIKRSELMRRILAAAISSDQQAT